MRGAYPRLCFMRAQEDELLVMTAQLLTTFISIFTPAANRAV